MTLEELYAEAVSYQITSVILLIEYLTLERKVLSFADDIEKLDYYLQERFQAKMNEYLTNYEVKKRERSKNHSY